MDSSKLKNTINCPRCGKELEVDSVREHRDGKKRVYWECGECDVSIMARNGNKIIN